MEIIPTQRSSLERKRKEAPTQQEVEDIGGSSRAKRQRVEDTGGLSQAHEELLRHFNKMDPREDVPRMINSALAGLEETGNRLNKQLGEQRGMLSLARQQISKIVVYHLAIKKIRSILTNEIANGKFDD